MFGRSGPIPVLTSPFAAVSAAAMAEAAAAAAAASAEAADDKRADLMACGAPTGQESSSDVSHQTNGLALGCARTILSPHGMPHCDAPDRTALLRIDFVTASPGHVTRSQVRSPARAQPVSSLA